MMKKLLAIVLSLVMLTAASAALAENKTVGILQFAEHGSLDNCREGFLQGLAEAGYVEGENLTIKYYNAQADGGTDAQIAQSLVAYPDLRYCYPQRAGGLQRRAVGQGGYPCDLHCRIRAHRGGPCQ